MAVQTTYAEARKHLAALLNSASDDRETVMTRLADLAKTIRSKNAGVNQITFDVIFAERAVYERVKRARVLTRESICKLYRIAPERIADFVEFDPGNAIKFTLFRLRPRYRTRPERHHAH